MTIELTDSTATSSDVPVVHGSGSVSHQIIGEFLLALEMKDGYKEIAQDLRATIFDGKPTEAALRIALFGEDPL